MNLVHKSFQTWAAEGWEKGGVINFHLSVLGCLNPDGVDSLRFLLQIHSAGGT